MKVSSFGWDGNDPRELAAELRTLQPSLAEVSEAVAEIIAAVAAEGDAAVVRYEERFGTRPTTLRVPRNDLISAASALEPGIRNAIEVAAENVTEAAEEQDRRGDDLQADGSRRVVPVAAAGAYAPGGRAAYPSTAVMCCVPARVAGVERIALVSPPGEDGAVNPLVMGAASLAGATEVYATGGAQAVAALALGTESIEPVDVIVGPGNRYVQEAKRQLVGRVGIDGIAGPSELMVIADDTAEPRLLALDLCAQAEHGDDGLLVVCAADDDLLDEIEKQTLALAAGRESVRDAPLAFVKAPSAEVAVDLANALAPEHLELACADAEKLSADVLYAGCVFVGREGATAFGDYAAGSNHVLPTGGAGRFQGPLGPETFRRAITTVKISSEAARELAPVVATLAEAEGFPVHGESVMARIDDSEGTK